MKVKYLIFDHDTLTDAMLAKGRSSVLVAGNHVERDPIVPRDDEYVIAFADNCVYNKLPRERIDMLASANVWGAERFPSDAPQLWTMMYPHGMDNFAAIGRSPVYLLDNLTMKAGYDAIGLNWLVAPPTPTTGFTTLMALKAADVRVRVSGFSFYIDTGDKDKWAEARNATHKPANERIWVRDNLLQDPLFSFTPETLSYLQEPVT